MNPVDLIWTGLAFILTLLVFSYAIVGDNVLFRIATYALIGVAAAYVVLVTFNQVIWPKFVLALLRNDISYAEKALLVVPLLLSLMLLTKAFPRIAKFGTLPLAFLVGVGAAAMLSGIVLGTLFPQTLAAINAFDMQAGRAQTAGVAVVLMEGVVLLAGTGFTLLYFQFTARSRPGQVAERGALVANAAEVGQVFIATTLGALFAGVYLASLTTLIERLTFLWHTIIP